MEKQKRSRVSVISEDILRDRNLTPSEKMVYARICFFEEFFESAETTADYLGVKIWTVQSAKRKLEKLGYIICVKNTGRGKRYVADVNYGARCRREQSQTLEKPTSDFGKTNIRLGDSQHQTLGFPNSTTEEKTEVLGKNIGKNLSKKLDEKENISLIKERTSPVEIPAKKSVAILDGKERIVDENGKVAGGNPLTARAYELWEEVMGEPCKRSKQNSGAGWNLMRAKDKGEEWLKGMLIIARECKKDPKADFRASGVACLADLQKNQDYVLDWYRRYSANNTTPAGKSLDFLRNKR